MYQVIARKYRPQSFAELIGQEPVRVTLENAISSRRLAHGYILAGQRGTGKTTVARILARCLNCVQGPTTTPCGVCASCREIAAGSSPDVIEIDAASNRGINEMRELRENVRYRPARDRYKIFIIDEAHQITSEAFNALLKTLEEPPEWAVFILCTTEAHKIPNTIASRCQQFSFRSVDFAELLERLRFIVKEEGIEADDEVLALIAQNGEGSVRDSLSALDQAIACCGKVLNVESVRALLGMFGVRSLQAVAAAVRQEDGHQMLEIVQELERTGQNLQHFCRELARYWRNLLVAKIARKPTRLIAASDQEQETMLAVASGFSEEDLTRYLQITLDLFKTMQSSLQPRFHLELGLIKLIQVGRLQPIEEALAQLAPDAGAVPSAPIRATANAPRTEIARLAPPPPPAKSAEPTAPPPPSVPKPVAAELASPAAAAPRADLKADLVSALLGAGLKLSADAVQHSELTLDGAHVKFTTAKRFMLGLRDGAVADTASKLLNKPVKVSIEIDAAMSSAAAALSPEQDNTSPAGDNSEAAQRALSHPGVKRFQELFPGAQVRSVRNLNE